METFRTHYEKSWLPRIENYSQHSFKLRIYPSVLLTLWARWQRWHPACKKFCSNKQDLAGLGVAVEKMGWGNTNWSCERLCKVVTQRPLLNWTWSFKWDNYYGMRPVWPTLSLKLFFWSRCGTKARRYSFWLLFNCPIFWRLLQVRISSQRSSKEEPFGIAGVRLLRLNGLHVIQPAVSKNCIMHRVNSHRHGIITTSVFSW